MMAGCKKKDLTSCEKVSEYGSSNQEQLVGNWELDYIKKGSKKVKLDYTCELNIFEPNKWAFGTIYLINDKRSYGNSLMFSEVSINSNNIQLGKGFMTLMGLYPEHAKREEEHYRRIKDVACFSVTKKRLYLLFESEEDGVECFVYKRDNSDKSED